MPCGHAPRCYPPCMTPLPAPDATDPRAWFEAQGAFAADLAAFQATNPMTPSYVMEDVLRAAAPAFKLGFAYSIQWVQDDVAHVRLMHRSGWDLVSVAVSAVGLWESLADLLGITPGQPASAFSTLAEPTPAAAPEPVAAAPEPTPTPAPAPDPDEFADADLMGEGTPDTPVLPEDREPLSEADRETCLAMIRAATSEQRKQFNIAFRSHFNIDKSQRTIAPHIVQVQHQKFIQTFLDELELAEVAA